MQTTNILNGLNPFLGQIITNRPDPIDKNNSNKVFKYPFITSENFAATMKNYEKYISIYNDHVLEQNQEVKKYNALVDAMLKAKKADLKAVKLLQQDFKKDNNALFVRNYNAKVEQYNTQHGPTLHKRKFVQVKWNSILIFKAVLGFYVSQIKKNNQYRMQGGIKTTRQLEKIKIDSNQLSNATIDGIEVNPVHKKTFQRHVKRLREAGVLIDYTFINSQKPIQCNINPKILVISDIKTSKPQNAKNQPFKENGSTKCTYNNHTTRTNKDNIKMKEDFNTKSSENPSNNGNENYNYKNTSRSNKKIDTQANQAAQNLTQNQYEIIQAHQTSTILRDKILDLVEFAENLHAGEYTNYTKIPLKTLLQELKYGTLDKAEFRQIVIQDTIKQLAKNWANMPKLHIGSWVNALKTIEDNWLITFNGFVFNKQTIFEHAQQYNWRAKYVNRWFKKNSNRRILYPSEYFNPNRTHSFECGWKFTEQKYKSKLSKTPQQRTEAKTEAKKRKAYNYKLKQMQTQVRMYADGKKTLQEVNFFLETNGYPESIKQLLASEINKYHA